MNTLGRGTSKEWFDMQIDTNKFWSKVQVGGVVGQFEPSRATTSSTFQT